MSQGILTPTPISSETRRTAILDFITKSCKPGLPLMTAEKIYKRMGSGDYETFIDDLDSLVNNGLVGKGLRPPK